DGRLHHPRLVGPQPPADHPARRRPPSRAGPPRNPLVPPAVGGPALHRLRRRRWGSGLQGRDVLRRLVGHPLRRPEPGHSQADEPPTAASRRAVAPQADPGAAADAATPSEAWPAPGPPADGAPGPDLAFAAGLITT